MATRRNQGARESLSRRLLLLIFCLGVGLLAGPAAAQEHHWRKIEVAARLEADGSISVQERQHMVFTGALNGGERIFRLMMRQHLDFKGISRQDEAGNLHPLEKGDLEKVDQYQFVSSKTLRWRSRLPSDPAFDNTLLIYQLDYRITGVVLKKGEHFVLSHDFLFPDRIGEVESFTLDLDIDPAWQVVGDWRRHATAGPVPPGEGYVVNLTLDWAGSAGQEPPSPRRSGGFLPLQLLALLATAGGLFYLQREFRRQQGALGRFDPLPALPAGQEAAWVEENLLKFQPEVVGALWDRSIGAPEVAALLARWVSEGRLRSRVAESAGILGLGKKQVLHLELLDDRDHFEGSERTLIDRFFFDGRREVDSESLRERYKSSGFNPVSIIKDRIEGQLYEFAAWREKAQNKPAKKPTVLLILAGIGCALVDLVVDFDSAFFSLAFFSFPLIGTYLIPVFMGLYCRHRVEKVARSLFWISLPPLLYTSYLALMIAIGPIEIDPTFAWAPGFFAIGGFGLILLGLYRSILNIASSRETPEGITTRKWLASVRNYFYQELQKEQPAFSDRMFPYLMAFGLDRNVDRWFKAYGGVSTSQAYRHEPHTYGSGSSGSSGSSGAFGGGFTGGGGSFGGGGASASWAAAATSFSSGVAAPSSSSSSGGGSSSSSSSGGGGGGAW